MTAASWLTKLGDAEVRFCLRASRSCEKPSILGLFAAVSRLGDGVFWYVLIAALPLLYGTAGLGVAVQLAVAGMLGNAAHRLLKERLVRERPCNLHPRIRARARALDRYSFPSGHTLHAVSFSVITVTAFPALGLALARLVASSAA